MNDVGGMTLHSYCDIVPDNIFVAIGNCKLISQYTEAFINFTVNFQVNDCRMIPIIIPKKEITNLILDSVNQMINGTKRMALGIATTEEICFLASVESRLNSIIEHLYLRP